MAEYWFDLSQSNQVEALEMAANKTGRPPHLLEKDIWVVWTLAAIYGSHLANQLTFKGGTSLSKAFKIIDRFSEDVDLTYDIRQLVPDLLPESNPIPQTPSQENKISKAVKKRLPEWMQTSVVPVIQEALSKTQIEAVLSIAGHNNEKLIITYPALKTGTGYASANIQLEFGARATGEPNQAHEVQCDIASAIEDILFPMARPLVMKAERTFWEKATAAHVYCKQGRLRGERYSRHWYDLSAIAKTEFYETAVNDFQLAKAVAEHKSVFFKEKDSVGKIINYHQAVNGALQIIPTGSALDVLARDYSAMLEDGLLSKHQPSFIELIDDCRAIEDRINKPVTKNN